MSTSSAVWLAAATMMGRASSKDQFPRLIFTVFVALIWLFGTPKFAHAQQPGTVPLFTNFGPNFTFTVNNGSFVGNENFFPRQLVAMQFTPSVTGKFSDAILPLGEFTSGIVHTATLYLDADSNGAPGANLEQISVTVSGPWNATLTTFISTANSLLQAGTPYWIVADATLVSGPTPNSQLYWNANSIGNTGPGVYCSTGSNCGPTGPWSADTLRLAFEIDGVPQPQPGTVPLFSNFGPNFTFTVNNGSFVGNENVSPRQLVAMQFTPSVTGKFSDAILPLGEFTSGIVHTATLYLDADSSGSPGANLEQISVTVSGPWNATLTTFISTANSLLQAGTPYWIVADATFVSGPTSNSSLYWNANSIGNTGPGVYCAGSECGPGGPWSTDSLRLAFEIDGATSTPTVPVTVTSSPSGASITVSAESVPSAGPGCAPGTYTTPLNITWSADANCSITFTSPQSIGGSQYFFNSATVNGTNTTSNPLAVGAGTNTLAINAVFGPAAPPCTYTVSPTSQSFPFGGGTGSIVVTTTPGCDWTYSIQATWIHYVPSSIPQIACNPPCPSSPPFGYLVDPNPGSASRTGTITIAGQTVSITEAGTSTCQYSINPMRQTFTDSGGSTVVQVSTSTGCPWSVANNTNFVTIGSISVTSGNGSVSLNVGTNSGGPRSGTLTIADQPFTVMQNGSACGAIDVSDKVTVTQGTWQVFSVVDNLWSRTITLTNTTGATIPGIIYLVLDGLPADTPGYCQTLLNGCGLASPPQGTLFTHCPSLVQSSTGSYVIPWITGGLGPNQSYPTQQNPFCGTLPTSPPCVGLTFVGDDNSYTPIVLSGAPTQ